MSRLPISRGSSRTMRKTSTAWLSVSVDFAPPFLPVFSLFCCRRERNGEVVDTGRYILSSCLQNTKRRLSAVSKELDNLKWENEVLELRFEKCQSERDELHAKFVSAILEIQQKTGLKNVLLEKKFEKLSELLEQREAQISEVLAAAQLEPTAVVNVNRKLENMLNRKNTAIQDLQSELAKVCKAHDELLTTYENKLQEYGIPKSELGVQPLRAKVFGSRLGTGIVVGRPNR